MGGGAGDDGGTDGAAECFLTCGLSGVARTPLLPVPGDADWDWA